MSIARLVGHVDNGAFWYKLKDGRTVSFHTVFFDKDHAGFTFESDNETWPSSIMKDLERSYIFMRDATSKEIEELLLESEIELEGESE
jgi:hypothetical protein